MATAQDALDNAIARSSLNNASMLSTNDVLRTISLYQRRVYLLAARLNPNYFGKSGDTSVRAAFTDSWDISATPGDVAAVMKVTVAAIIGTVTGVAVGDEVRLIDIRWPDLQISPRASLRGRKIAGHSTELGASSTNMVSKLSVSYAELPPVVSALASTLRLPDEWLQLIEIPLARLFALRDKREEELQFLTGEYGEVLTLFQEAVLSFDHGVVRPLSAVPALPIQLSSPTEG